MSTQPQAAIEVEGLSLQFRPFVDQRPSLRRLEFKRRRREPITALEDVSFRINRGEAFGIIGRNGAGKSTLLRLLAGTLQPDAGTIDVHGTTSTLLQLGAGFNAELSGLRNIYLGSMAVGLKKTEIDSMVDDIVEYSELGPAIHRPIKTYSSGMHSRLAFSIGIRMKPDILLLDEVLAVGDRSFRQKSLESLHELLEDAGTIVFVSHSLPSVREFCDRALWLDQGRVRARGTADQVIEKYQKVTNRETRRKRLAELADGEGEGMDAVVDGG